jgi:hypothetical protein
LGLLLLQYVVHAREPMRYVHYAISLSHWAIAVPNKLKQGFWTGFASLIFSS